MTTRLSVQDLLPNTEYAIRVRAKNSDGFSEWSNRLLFTTINDTTAPEVPQNVTWVSVGDSFHAEWDAVTKNISNEDINITRYEVELGANSILRIVSVTATTGGRVTFDLDFEQNKALFGMAQPNVTLRVRAVDNKNLKSDWSEMLTAGNPPPGPPTDVVVTPGLDSLEISWTAPEDDDLIGYAVYTGTNADFTPSGANQIFSGMATRFTYPTTTYVEQFFKIRAVDKFGQESTDALGSGTPVSPFVVDSTAPPLPVIDNVAMANNTNGVGASATVSWSITDPPNDLAGFYVRYRKVGDTFYSTVSFQKDERSGKIELPLAYTNYEFQIKSRDWSNNESGWSGVTIGTAPANQPPPQVTGLTGAAGIDSIRYTWNTSSATDIREYELVVSTSPTFASGNITFKTGTANSLTVSGLEPGTTYYARVRAVDMAGLTSTSWSATDTRATNSINADVELSDGNPPASSPTPTGASGIGYINVTWSPVVNNDLVAYEVHLGTTVAFTPSAATKVGEAYGTSMLVRTLPGTTTPLAYNTNYYFKTIAKDVDGAAAASAGSAAVQAKKAGSTDVTITPDDIGSPSDAEFNDLSGRVDDSIKTYVAEYAVNSSETTAPTTGWSTTTPTRTPGTFIWYRTVVTYHDNTTATTSPALLTGNTGATGSQGTQGPTGPTGVGVSSIVPYYFKTAEAGTAPAKPTTATPPAGWTTTEPGWTVDSALWRTEKVTYTNSTFSYTNVTKVSSYTAAVAAMASANGVTRNFWSAAPASGTSLNGRAFVAGDTWWQHDGAGKVIGQWEFTTSWQPRQINHQMIASIDVGNMTVIGKLTAANIEASGLTIQSSQVPNLDTTLAEKADTDYVDSVASEVNNAQFLNKNSTFSDWTGTYPNNTSVWSHTAIKNTSIYRTGGKSMQYNVTVATHDAGANIIPMLSDMGYSEYITIECDAYLISGNFSGAGVLLDWQGVTGDNRSNLAFNDLMPNPQTGKWYRFTRTFKRPNTGGSWTGWGAYLMANYSSGLGALTAKNIVFDRVGFRHSTTSEIEAYETQGNINNVASELTDYIKSRGTDLVTNGTGYLGDNTNFSTYFTFDGSDAPVGANGSFVPNSAFAHAAIIDELIPYDPSKSYRLSMALRQLNSGSVSRAYGFIAPYDAFGNQIVPGHFMYITDTTTTLAQPLNPGDTTITLTSAANWYGSAAKPAAGMYYCRGMIFWDYVDSGGKLWPLESYSRNYYYDMWADGGITGNTITLRTPWAGPAKPAGTALSNSSAGGTYMYMPSLSNHVVPEQWTTYSDVLPAGTMSPAQQRTPTTGGAGFLTGVPPGTAQVTVGWLLNYAPTSGKQAVAAVSFSDAAAANATIDSWRNPTDRTKIEGGVIQTHTVDANVLKTSYLESETITLANGGAIRSNLYRTTGGTQGFRLTDAGLELRSGVVYANTLVSGTGILDELVINTGGAIRSSNYSSTAGFKISNTGIEINSSGSSIKADAIKAGTLGGSGGSGVINVAAGTSLIMNGGYIKSNTNTGTTLATAETSGAGFFLNADGLFIGGTSRIKANALISDTLTSTTITLGSGGAIQGGSWILNSSGLQIPDGAISAAKVNIQSGSNLMPAPYADFEYYYTYYDGKMTSGGTKSIKSGGVFNNQYLEFRLASAVEVYLSESSVDYNIPVEPGKNYIVSAYVRAGQATSVNARLRVRFSNGTFSGFFYSATIPANGAWQRVSGLTGVVSSGVTAMVVVPYSGAGGFDIDGVQVEEQVGASTTPSSWSPPGLTRIDGGIIRTGEIRSTSFTTISGLSLPTWSIPLNGAATFSNLNVYGNAIVGRATNDTTSMLSSANYIAGTVGWRLTAAGTLDVAGASSTITGATIRTAPSGARVQISGDRLDAYNSTGWSIFGFDASDGTAWLGQGTNAVIVNNDGLRGGRIQTTPVSGNVSGSIVMTANDPVYGMRMYDRADGATTFWLNPYANALDAVMEIRGRVEFMSRPAETSGTTLFHIASDVITRISSNDVTFYGNTVTFTNGFYSQGAIEGSQVFAWDHNTTGNGPNTFIRSTDGLLMRSTSSLRYKKAIRPLNTKADELLKLEPRTFKSTTKQDDPNEDFVGFIAEEAEELGLSEWVSYDEQGRPDAFGYATWTVALQQIARAQRDEINDLKDKIDKLEKFAKTSGNNNTGLINKVARLEAVVSQLIDPS